jgi:hypothetical protein
MQGPFPERSFFLDKAKNAEAEAKIIFAQTKISPGKVLYCGQSKGVQTEDLEDMAPNLPFQPQPPAR